MPLITSLSLWLVDVALFELFPQKWIIKLEGYIYCTSYVLLEIIASHPYSKDKHTCYFKILDKISVGYQKLFVAMIRERGRRIIPCSRNKTYYEKNIEMGIVKKILQRKWFFLLKVQ